MTGTTTGERNGAAPANKQTERQAPVDLTLSLDCSRCGKNLIGTIGGVGQGNDGSLSLSIMIATCDCEDEEVEQ